MYVVRVPEDIPAWGRHKDHAYLEELRAQAQRFLMGFRRVGYSPEADCEGIVLKVGGDVKPRLPLHAPLARLYNGGSTGPYPACCDSGSRYRHGWRDSSAHDPEGAISRSRCIVSGHGEEVEIQASHPD